MRVWNLLDSVPPAKLRTTALDIIAHKRLTESCTNNSAGGKLVSVFFILGGHCLSISPTATCFLQSQLILRGLSCKVNISIFGYCNSN